MITVSNCRFSKKDYGVYTTDFALNMNIDVVFFGIVYPIVHSIPCHFSYSCSVFFSADLFIVIVKVKNLNVCRTHSL
jgi:hypothetical protein